MDAGGGRLRRRTARPVRLVTLTDATTPSGRSRAQAAAQLARAPAGATEGASPPSRSSIEASRTAAPAAGELVAHLWATPSRRARRRRAGRRLRLARAAQPPPPVGSLTYGGPAVPAWLDSTLRDDRP